MNEYYKDFIEDLLMLNSIEDYKNLHSRDGKHGGGVNWHALAFYFLIIYSEFIMKIVPIPLIMALEAWFALKKKKNLPLLSRISILALEKIVPCHPYKFYSFLCRRVLESSTQIQDRLPRLSLSDLLKKPLQINVDTRI